MLCKIYEDVFTREREHKEKKVFERIWIRDLPQKNVCDTHVSLKMCL